MIKTPRVVLRIAGLVVAAALFTTVASAQQASITLRNCDTELCYNNDTEWTLTKTADTSGLVNGSGPLLWTIIADRGATSDNLIKVNGVLTIANTGTAGATIGNIVVNLQRPNSSSGGKGGFIPWVSAAANVADATLGDAATSAKIVAAGSAENAVVNASQGPGNYTVSGAQGTFIETSGSGTLEFTDALSNTAFSLVPQLTIAPGAEVTLLFIATFNNTLLGLAAGSSVRVEALVTFGNAGARGGSGASAPNIDINGNGMIDSDEGPAPVKVRTVPCRETRTIPALEECNGTVTLSDLESDIQVTGNIMVSNYVTDIGGGTGTESISVDVTRLVMVTVTCDGTASGTIVNTAHLDGASSSVTVQGPQTGVDGSGNPTYDYYDFPCCVGVDLDAASNVASECTGGFMDDDFCTYTQGGWGAKPMGGNPGTILHGSFAAVYPTGVEVGIPGAGGFSMKFTTAAAVTAYLPAGGPPSALTGDLVNPTSSSAGVFGGQVLALQLNVDFSAAGVTQGPGGPVGALKLCNFGNAKDGVTVAQVLADANTALGGGALPGYVLTLSELNGLVTDLNESFDDCDVGAFAQAHLCQ